MLAAGGALLLGCGGARAGSGAGGGGAASGTAGSGATGTGGYGPSPCASLDNPPGPHVVEVPWPIAGGVKNDGYDLNEGDSASFAWNDGAAHAVFQLPLWTSPETDPGFPHELSSGPASKNGTFTWNSGTFPCGYRPGLYFVGDSNPVGIAAALSLTVPQATGTAYFSARACTTLGDPLVYEGRYGAYASRADCKIYEVNNFLTETHFDWLSGTGTSFGLLQGDLLLFRWSNEHNVVQVHDEGQDQPVPGGIVSGDRTNCVPGPGYRCINGGPELGEHLIDTTDHRPGLIHLSDQCAFGCATCPANVACHGNATSATGTNFQVLLQRRVRPAPPTPGACCAIDKTKGQACRVIDVYNDNEGTQLDTGLGGGLTVNRGDLVRFRWAGALRIVQTRGGKDGAPSKTPMPNGVAMPAPVECVPGPHWTCLGGTTDQARFLVDVDKLVGAGSYETFSYGGTYLNFYAFADNSKDPAASTQDSATLLPIADMQPYASNAPCP